MRSSSLGELPGLSQLTAHDAREEKLDKFCKIISYAERAILAHFLDEANGDLEQAIDLFTQKSLFAESSNLFYLLMNFRKKICFC